jgi:hypothetical protein
MAFQELPVAARTVVAYRPGDFVASQTNSYPVLLEIIGLEDDGLLRVRGLGWAPGYTAVIARDQVRHVNAILPAR